MREETGKAVGHMEEDEQKINLDSLEVSSEEDAKDAVACSTELIRIRQKRSEVLTRTDRVALEKEAYKLDRIYNKNTCILEEGKFYDAIFFLLAGELELRVKGIPVAHIVAQEKQSFVFGTVNYILGQRTPFSVHSKSRVIIRELSSKVIERISNKDPFWGARLYEYLSYDLVNSISQVWVEFCKGDQMLQRNEMINKESESEGSKIKTNFVLANTSSGFSSTNSIMEAD